MICICKGQLKVMKGSHDFLHLNTSFIKSMRSIFDKSDFTIFALKCDNKWTV